MDDLLILAKHHTDITTFLNELGKYFDFQNNSPVSLFLGMEIIYNSDELFLHQ